MTGAYLGVYVRDVDTSGQSYGLSAGAYIEEAIRGYCAQKAGIRTGDIIVNLGGYDVDSVTTLTRVLRRFKAGETVSVTVYRAGKQEYLNVTLDEKPVQTAAGITKTMAPRDAQSVDEYQLEIPISDVHDFYRNFVDAIDGKADQAIRNDEVRRVMAVMEAAHKSWETKSYLQVNI